MGRATFVPAGGCSGELYPLDSVALVFGGLPFLDFFVSGNPSELPRARGRPGFAFTSGSVCLSFPLVGLLVGSSTGVPFSGIEFEAALLTVFFFGRPLFGVGLCAFSTSDPGFSGIASIDGLDFLDGTRENWNPSSSCS